MHEVKTQRFGELFVKNRIKNIVIYYFYMVVIKTYKAKKFFNKFP